MPWYIPSTFNVAKSETWFSVLFWRFRFMTRKPHLFLQLHSFLFRTGNEKRRKLVHVMKFLSKSLRLSEERKETFKKCNNYTKELSKTCNRKTANTLLLQPFRLIYWIQRPSFLYNVVMYYNSESILAIYIYIYNENLGYTITSIYIENCFFANSILKWKIHSEPENYTDPC